MKKNVFLILLIALIFSLQSCGERKCGDPYSRVAIYKTKVDCSDLAQIEMKGEKIYEVFYASQFIKIINGDTVILDDPSFKKPINLAEGYKIGDMTENTVFLSLSWKELFKLEQSLGRRLTKEEARMYILDKEPFLEYYRDGNCPQIITPIDTVKLNNMIHKKELCKYFERFK